jgi:alkylation response protein AidB-like acyl-CoA dehydrogenase
MSEYSDAIERVIDETVALNAMEVDSQATFPRANLEALAKAGALGLVSSTDVGGAGQGMDAAAAVIERLSAACGSTAMVLLMHFAATALIEAHGPESVRGSIGSSQHLSTLAFSEVGSRSHFWAPLGRATREGDLVRLDARKSWVTSAGEADSYVWSSRPVDAEGPMSLWLVPSDADGLSQPSGFDGLGLRGNASTPVTADGVRIAGDSMLGADGAGLDLALAAVLPWFLVLSAAFSLGLMEAVTAETIKHVTGTRLEHLDQSLAEQPLVRADVAPMRIQTDMIRALLNDTLAALAAGRQDAMLRVLEIKAAAAEAAIAVTDQAMKVCGGAAFRKELGVERRFRDARAARVMAPTTDALHDFIGRAVTGQALLG